MFSRIFFAQVLYGFWPTLFWTLLILAAWSSQNLCSTDSRMIPLRHASLLWTWHGTWMVLWASPIWIRGHHFFFKALLKTRKCGSSRMQTNYITWKTLGNILHDLIPLKNLIDFGFSIFLPQVGQRSKAPGSCPMLKHFSWPASSLGVRETAKIWGIHDGFILIVYSVAFDRSAIYIF